MEMKHSSPKPVRILKRNVLPHEIANQYLYHEFLKIFWDVKDKSFRRKIKQSLFRMRKRDGKHTYWLLVAGIGEGWRVKWVYRLLTNPGYVWNLEERKISDLTMTGFNPQIVDRIIMRSGRNFYRFAEYYHKHRVFFKKYMPNLKSQPERDNQPVLIFYDHKEGTMRLFDGMRRTVLAAIANKKTIKAYVGYPLRKGKAMVNLDKIQYLRLLFLDARKDRETYRSFVHIGREMVRQSQNAAQAFRNSIKPWTHSRERNFILDILK